MCVVTAVLVLTGCSAPGVAGSGGPASFEGIELPPRPRDIDVRDIDPCSLLTEEQRAEVGLETEPLSYEPTPSILFEGLAATCTSRAFDPVAFGVAVDLTYDGLGIGALTGRPVSDELTVMEFEGFPAVLARPQDPLFCQVVVDVAPGSSVSLGYREGGRRTIPQDVLCDGVLEVAEKAMSTLVSMN
jgi:hypothetical protein